MESFFTISGTHKYKALHTMYIWYTNPVYIHTIYVCCQDKCTFYLLYRPDLDKWRNTEEISKSDAMTKQFFLKEIMFGHSIWFWNLISINNYYY